MYTYSERDASVDAVQRVLKPFLGKNDLDIE